MGFFAVMIRPKLKGDCLGFNNNFIRPQENIESIVLLSLFFAITPLPDHITFEWITLSTLIFNHSQFRGFVK